MTPVDPYLDAKAQHAHNNASQRRMGQSETITQYDVCNMRMIVTEIIPPDPSLAWPDNRGPSFVGRMQQDDGCPQVKDPRFTDATGERRHLLVAVETLARIAHQARCAVLTSMYPSFNGHPVESLDEFRAHCLNSGIRRLLAGQGISNPWGDDTIYAATTTPLLVSIVHAASQGPEA